MTGYDTIPAEQRRWKYRRTEPLTQYVGILGHRVVTQYVSLTVSGFLTLSPGYAWDGMSWIVRDTPDSMDRSAVHDALYQLGRLGLLPDGWRAQADAVFLEMGLEEANQVESRPARWWKKARARYTWAGVRIFGGLWNRRAAAKE